ncbi:MULTISPECIES: hypothetical protein [Cellulophaga]|uniref:Uncharacterized protein n=1 Tax=Cellulophaga lytica (strain ATCC 23178 / DSM 7489 / JCM 8516 / NBRC 14961 / NCIMB 1423 / VKM B-1433 / Cy l20) TaxID=867900 RepID=F0RGG0_CELLC|nr:MULTISPECIES: hypothetical protein [Cellulophaga]ADY27985.1 hypothetical protein Celly_0150 [Cellulophaga lytica DSM 7489]AIM59065.1 hypothetical protein IX49_00415 [Cellulophaga lytica]TVZ09445.1 hypothetical protein JM80_1971 [Cellulophaga sp. RHA_52]WQG77824.1 hypothetical protein SR888_02635 [Cellulophaga lytica]
MELHNIEKLLEKYFEATTTVAEEETLKAYFLQGDVAPHLQEYTTMFTYFSNAKEETFTKQVPLKPRKRNYKWLSVAAVAVLVLGIYFGNDYREQKEAEYVLQETEKAFSLIAQNLNKGTEKLVYLNKFEEATNKIYKTN